ncbi:MAG: haloacid dehalogenase type II [Planctomycetes bacterium]|nr:haloacid dehalogenase type II [Planctomycetota bacterium]MBI3835948.1 haloacid dehalogenase type II [Planctomycetota bacterium]
MLPLSEIHPRITTLTFDCYGTLIDWDAGLWSVFRDVFPSLDSKRRRELFDAYVRLEAEIESAPYKSYRMVTAEALQRVAEQFNQRLDHNQGNRIAEKLPQWPPFPDTNDVLRRLKKRFRLGILSNIDRDLFAGTAKHFTVEFDFIVTAEDVRSYKPADGHFLRLLEKHARTDEVIHVGQSPYHDGLLAANFGIPFVWINRYNDMNKTTATPVTEFPNLRSFADFLNV